MSDRLYRNDDVDAGNGGISVTGFLLGAVVGAGIALLLAPAPGSETRKKVGQTAKKLGNRAGDLVNRGGDEEDEEPYRKGSPPVRGSQGEFGDTSHRSAGGQAGEPYRSGGRRETPGESRTPHSSPQPGTYRSGG